MCYLLIRVAVVLFVNGGRIRSKAHKRLWQRVLPLKKKKTLRKNTQKHANWERRTKNIYISNRKFFGAANENRKVRRRVICAIVNWRCGVIRNGGEEPRQLPCFNRGEEREAAGWRTTMNPAVEGEQSGGAIVEVKVFEEMTAQRRECKRHWRNEGVFFRSS